MTAFEQNVWDNLAMDQSPGLLRPAATKVENWIEQQVGNGSVIEGPTSPNAGMVKTADCFKITCGGASYCIGSDKIGHFFQQGHMLNEIKTSFGKTKGTLYAEAFSRWTEGRLGGPDRQTWPGSDPRFANIDPTELFNWLKTGTFTFYGFNDGAPVEIKKFEKKWGSSIRGPVPLAAQRSQRDIRANFSGMLFWDALRAGKINGTTRPFDICDPKYGVKPGWEE